MGTLQDLLHAAKKSPNIDYNYVFTYGKHKGAAVTEVLENDPGYIVWASENIPNFNPTEELLSEARYLFES